jgi:hypothetical protein
MPTKRAILYRADGTFEELGHKPSLSEAQQLVGGYVEVVRPRGLFDGGHVQFLADEEGHLPHKAKPPNRVGTTLYMGGAVNTIGDAHPHFPPNIGAPITDHWIAGDIIVLVGWRFD